MAVQKSTAPELTAEHIRALITQYIEQSPHQYGRDNARLKDSGISVVAIINALLYAGGDLYVAAREYEIPDDAVRAAVYYYSLNKQVIDARMIVDEAAWHPDDDLDATVQDHAPTDG